MNDLSKILSRLFTAIASLEKFISKRKVIHIILTFCRENGANTTFLIKSHDTKKVGITIKVSPTTYNTENVQFGGLMQKKNAATEKNCNAS